MAESGRVKKKSGGEPASQDRGGTATHDAAPAKRSGPDWAGQPAGVGVPLQRKARVNEPGDAYEKEAESVGDRVATGGQYPAQKISSVTPGSSGGGPRHAAKAI